MSNVEEKLGALLKLERERQNVKLDDLAENLRIPIANLEFIERGEVSNLPSEIYFGLFAKSYAEAVGVDYAATVQAIKDDLKETPPPPKSKKKPSAPADDETTSNDKDSTVTSEYSLGLSRDMWRKLMWVGAAIVLVVGGFFVGRQLLHDMQQTTYTTDTATDKVGASTSPAPIGSREESYANYDWNTPAYHEPDDLKLKLTARSSSWAAVFADGDTAIYRNLVVGKVYEVTAKYRLTLSVAVPRMVNIELNGVKINPVSPTTGRITKVRITQVNVDSFLHPPSPEPQTDQVPKSPEPETNVPVNLTPEIDSKVDTFSVPVKTPLETEYKVDSVGTQGDIDNGH